ncbi:E3 ubiquitin-protein ligase ZNF598 [Python bivittatus]|uniref:RING-type E3 ubiquitin transferase n=1 Tax=Python bivittatus TaxID=176946 RepID=A0A9F5J7Z1_PYTBI|nr:E3 ubiquitin-protein ligase ZNF598 [Python bivittatus]XP_025029298.1 E3 ubiquitin-protein ligase ZNF598 [Python bivittatus]XP_025029299.1 E3 ubiquitin-protein ligase ZNF598 [Python bivittatus]XP_025029300.1 E3 ubiquitin-protein ligase ZNF598 [Python bivittatus]
MAASPPLESRSADGPGSCVLCCGELEVVALGRCEHPICYRCSVRMRALCGVRYCAVCREELAQVVFGKKLPPFSTIILSQLQHEKKYDIYFTDGKVYALYRKLLQHECPLCLESRAFPTIVDLEQHMRKQHELFCCKLCVKHLKIFTYERKWYSRKDLARHRIHGDPDDTSHRGHPLCKFCDERYLDNDELLKHLRRDHYFCHFCDSDGAQEYYSDYEYLREHFREKHFLCEEGRCSTEQFTHAFRTEIDYKAHKTACHSKNRAEARQNRQIDLQFNYAPRHQRRSEGVVSGEDYEEVDRYNRQVRGGRSGPRGGQQNRRGSWRYKREEEDRDIAAAVRASVAAKRQEEKKRVEDKEDNSRAKKEDAKDPDATNSKRGLKPSSEAPVPKEAVPKAALSQDDFPAIGSPAVNSVQSSSQLASVKLDEEDFPSLSISSAPPVVSAAMPLSYTATAQKTAFQEEDFPALVSKVRPGSKMVSTLASAWSGGSSKNMARAITATASSASQPTRKGASAGSSKASKKSKVMLSNDTQDSGGSITTQEIRSVPTMVDVSSLLAASNSQTFVKVGKKKKVGTEKLRTASPPTLQEMPASLPSAEKAADAEHPSTVAASPNLPSASAALVNGHSEKSMLLCNASKEPPGLKKPPVGGQCLLPQEDFPALGNAGPPRMPPPPGFNSVVLLSSPPPPPGLSMPPSKPPPGFTPIPATSISENAPAPVKEPKLCQGPYLILENFQQRNIQLIQSIKEFLQEDESQFNKFKTYSGQFRQGLISAAQYYKSCQELLGENFKKIFNELLVLLPDTAKQQELLSAYNDLKVKAPAGSSPSSLSRSKKNRKMVWQTEPASDLDCCVCPTCQQVLTQQDLVSHQALHLEEDEFPSLQAISRIIS